jgi:hypothetical protein
VQYRGERGADVERGGTDERRDDAPRAALAALSAARRRAVSSRPAARPIASASSRSLARIPEVGRYAAGTAGALGPSRPAARSFSLVSSASSAGTTVFSHASCRSCSAAPSPGSARPEATAW